MHISLVNYTKTERKSWTPDLTGSFEDIYNHYKKSTKKWTKINKNLCKLVK